MLKLLEVWKDVKIDIKTNQISPYYQVSTFGEIRNKKTLKVLKQRTKKDGYKDIWLHKEKNSFQIHRLVFNTFKTTYYQEYNVHHIDGDKGNNMVDNLKAELPNEHKIKHKSKKGMITTQKLLKELEYIKESIQDSYSLLYRRTFKDVELTEKQKTEIEGIELLLNIGLKEIINKVEKNYSYEYATLRMMKG